MLVDEKRGDAEPQLVIADWHAGTRTTAGDTTVPTAVEATRHPERLVDDDAGGYLAPELATRPGADAVRADVFSLGAVAYRLFAGRAPADGALALVERLARERGGLELAADVDGVAPALSRLVARATHPDPGQRPAHMRAFLDGLEAVEAELTRPSVPDFDPARASKGDRLPHGIEVVRRLGQGGTAHVFAVAKDGREQVLKVARDASKNRYLCDEHAVLETLRHPGIVEVFGTVEIGERLGLLMEHAGTSLAERLRQDGRLSLDFLERWGADLLAIVQWLEEKGIAHRDLKPSNLAVKPVGRGDALHLVLFDFSLARTPIERVELGTPAYLDPFLRTPGRGRFDSAAERFAAAMTIHEMATGRLPAWGTGEADPLLVDDEVALDAEAFDPSVRTPLSAFFRRALARDLDRRFDNAEQMLRAWRRVFLAADQPVLPTPHETGEATGAPRDPLAAVTLATQIVELPLSARAFHALEHRGIADVRGLLAAPLGGLKRQRNVGDKTRQEILDLVGRLRPRFPSAAVASTTPAPGTTTPDGGTHTETPTAAEATAGATATALALDVIAARLVPRVRRANAGAQARAVGLLLGLERAPGLPPRPNQTEIARATGVTRARVSQLLQKARARWAERLPALTLVRQEVAALLDAHGGVMAEDELARALLARRGTRDAKSDRDAAARAVARAAVEAEGSLASPHFIVRRRRGAASPVLALVREVSGERDEQAAQALAAWALALGDAADALAADEPLPAPSAVLRRLGTVTPPAGAEPLAPARLVRLAAACSTRAAMSSRAELYPRGLAAERALTLAAGVAHGVEVLAADELRARVESRYPEAMPLPKRPALDRLVEASGLDLAWDEAAARYRSKVGLPLVSSTASMPSRVPGAPDDQARDLDRRLARARGGGYLVVRVDPDQAVAAARHLAARFDLVPRSLDALLLGALRRAADTANVDWSLVLRADAAQRDSRDWKNLIRLLDRALPTVERDLLATPGAVLLTEPGLLGRYDRLDLLERLRERLHDPKAGHALDALLVLVPADRQHRLPTLAGRAVPILGPSDFLDLPPAWGRDDAAGAGMKRPQTGPLVVDLSENG